MKVITYSRPRKDLGPVSESRFSENSEYVQPEMSGNCFQWLSVKVGFQFQRARSDKL